MAKYIDADRLKEEFQKRFDICKRVSEDDRNTLDTRDWYRGKYTAYSECLSFIDSLQQEQPSEDLEKAAEEYASINCDDYVDYESNICFIEEGMSVAFKAGAEWQKEQFEKNRLAACDAQTREEYERETDFVDKFIAENQRTPTFSDAINYGIAWQKEQMLKDAVEGYVNYYEDSGGKLMAEAQVGCPYHIGDKVKIVIVKED